MNNICSDFVFTMLPLWYVHVCEHAPVCRFLLFPVGREERYFDKFHVSPDGKHLVFVGTNGYLVLLSSKVSLQPVGFCLSAMCVT